MQDVNYQLFSDSVKDEVLLGIENPVDYENILDMLGLLEYKDRHHMSLSGGQKQVHGKVLKTIYTAQMN